MGGVEYSLRRQDPIAARELGRACGVGPVIGQVLLHRGMPDADAARRFLQPRLQDLTAPDSMADRQLAADRLVRAVRARERVVVFGDYDVDGTTSAALLADVLSVLGGDVATAVANRFDGGYGFSGPALARCRAAGAQLIVTCDCGSSDHERIAEAQRAGVDVIVVDHHLVPDEPLPALAFLNPHRPDCAYPYKGLASAGLAFMVGAAVRTGLGARLDLRPWLDLVALGTIADVAPLDGDNRRLVRAGLARLSANEGRAGSRALCQAAGVTGRVSSVDVAFRLAPRINAAGRLGDPSVAVDLLRADSPEQAREYASRLEKLNQQRKDIEQRVTREAIEQVQQVYGDDPATGVVAASEGWHPGVVGITAARLVDRLGVPALVLAFEGETGRGSGRAPDGFPLYDAVAECRADLLAFGGHQAAVGLTVRRDRLEALRAGFNDATRQRRASTRTRGLEVDAAIDGTQYPVPRADEVLGLEPMGQQNAEPLFAVEGAPVDEVSTVGKDARHLSLRVRLGRQRLRAFGYEQGHMREGLGATVDLVGHLRANPYRGGGLELRTVTVRTAEGGKDQGMSDVAGPPGDV